MTFGQPVPMVPSSWIRPNRRVPRAGRRSGALTDLQLTCRAGDHDLEILIRDIERSRLLEVVGQVTSASDLHVPCADVAVALVEAADGRVLEQVRTTTYGEFVFAGHPHGVLGLKVGDRVGAPVVLVWEADR